MFIRKQSITLLIAAVVLLAVNPVELVAQPFNGQYVRQGFSMILALSNKGDFGRVAYNPLRTDDPSGPPDSLGLEYPLGARIEHLYGGGLWIGGLLDTARVGTTPQLRLVSVSYEGWSGPLYEFFPGNSAADTIWKARRDRSNPNPAPPSGWNDFWQGALPYHPISDQDLYSVYTDTVRRPQGHIPMRLKVIQSSYAWDDPYAEAIIIFEYRIINMGVKPIDSAYVAYFFEADVGPINVANYWTRNFTEYIPQSRTAYTHNPEDAGSTPVGATLLSTPRGLDSLQYSFRYFSGQETPATDALKYAMLSSGRIDSSEYPRLSDSRFVFAFGPFTVRPQMGTAVGDTLKIAVAVISGYSRRVDHRIVLARNAARALDIYLNQGIELPATPPSPPLRVNVGFRRVGLDWKWQPGDDLLYGRPDPELNWDTTNQVARRDPLRYLSYTDSITGKVYFVPPGIDSTKGGRNFEAYRLWRSETPPTNLPSEPPNTPNVSYTLVRQYDLKVPEGYPDSLSFEFNTGLEYEFVDSNLVRGKTYVYSVTSVSVPNLTYLVAPNGDTVQVPVEPLESSKRTNAVSVSLPFAVSEEVGKVAVVPNPYRTDRDYTLESGGYEGLSGGWDETKRVVKFINLPELCTIRVFSLSGDLIRTIQHDGREGTGFSRGDHNMELLSESNRALASGVYIFSVESALGTQVGKFVIIR